MLWIDETISPPAPIDTVIFDVDGVLWETEASYDRTVQLTVAHLLRQEFGQADPLPVTSEELRLFRRAGGLNNDWHMTYTLLALRLVGRSDFAQAAAESEGRGMAWAKEILTQQRTGAGMIDYDQLVRLFNEYYWGSKRFAQLFEEAPRYVVDEPGCWQYEEQLIPDDLVDQLRGMGVRYFGIATGRNWMELNTVLQASRLGEQIPQETILTSDVLTKPDGRVLHWVLTRMAEQSDGSGASLPQAALFCGDTRDDLDAVLNYRQLTNTQLTDTQLTDTDENVDNPAAKASAFPQNCWMGAVAVISDEELDFFQEEGSNAAIDHIRHLPSVITQLNQQNSSSSSIK